MQVRLVQEKHCNLTTLCSTLKKFLIDLIDYSLVYNFSPERVFMKTKSLISIRGNLLHCSSQRWWLYSTLSSLHDYFLAWFFWVGLDYISVINRFLDYFFVFYKAEHYADWHNLDASQFLIFHMIWLPCGCLVICGSCHCRYYSNIFCGQRSILSKLGCAFGFLVINI